MYSATSLFPASTRPYSRSMSFRNIDEFGMSHMDESWSKNPRSSPVNRTLTIFERRGFDVLRRLIAFAPRCCQ